MLRIAHRGASGYEPENTLAAFSKAVAMHTDMIELDVRVCGSGELVIMHDARVDRTTNGSGKVSSLSLTDLKELDAGNGEKIPTLPEALDAIGTKAKININIKVRAAVKPTITLVAEYIHQGKFGYDHIILASANIYTIRQVQRMYPRIRTSIIIRYFSRTLFRVSQFTKPYAVQPFSKCVSKKFVQRMKEKGIAIFPWTSFSEEPGFIKNMKKMNVDGIISNYPDRV